MASHLPDSVRLAASACLTPLGDTAATLAALLRGERALQARERTQRELDACRRRLDDEFLILLEPPQPSGNVCRLIFKHGGRDAYVAAQK